MEERLDSPGLKKRANELLAFQRDLKEEKEFLQKLLVKIDDQVHALQVEQLHLLGLMNKALKGTTNEAGQSTSQNDNQATSSTSKTLDLSIAAAFKYFEEEDDEFDEEDDDED